MHKFHHEMLPTSFKELFLKTTADIVIIQDMQPTKIYFIQVSTNAEKKFSHREATLWANVELQFKDKSHNAFRKQYRSFLMLQYE